MYEITFVNDLDRSSPPTTNEFLKQPKPTRSPNIDKFTFQNFFFSLLFNQKKCHKNILCTFKQGFISF